MKIANGTVGVADLSAAAQTSALHATGPAEVTLDQPGLKEAVSLTLPSAGTYVIYADATVFGSDPTADPDTDHAAADIVLAAGGSAIKSQNIQFILGVVDGTNDVATYPWEHVAGHQRDDAPEHHADQLRLWHVPGRGSLVLLLAP